MNGHKRAGSNPPPPASSRPPPPPCPPKTTAQAQHDQLIAELRASTTAQRELADAVRMLAAAVHAQADAIAAAVGEEPEPATGDAPEHDSTAPHGRYVDGEPIGT